MRKRAYATQVSDQDRDSWFNGTDVHVNTANIVSNDAEDRYTSYVYDEAGRLTSSVQANDFNDIVVSNTYDGGSQLTDSVTGNRTTQFFYDDDGRLIATVNAENYLTTNTYDSAGRMVSTTTYPSVVTNVTNNVDAMIAEASSDNIATENTDVPLTSYYFYDSQGRQIGNVNEQGFLTEVEFDALNRVTYSHSYMTAVQVNPGDTLSSLTLRASAEGVRTSATHFGVDGRVFRNCFP